MRKGYVIPFFVIILAIFVLFSFPKVQGQGHTIQIRLNINNTSNTVYIPGVGEVPSGSLGTVNYTSPPHYYLASYSGGYLTGLVAADGNSLGVSNTVTYHTLEIDQDAEEETFLVLSQGDWNNIEKEIVGVESDKFLKYPSPSFGFGLGDYYPLTVLLGYTDIDIEGSLDQSKGILRLTIENKGISGNRPVVEIRKS
ncbi:MAG: hypothetical protein JSW41_03595 [Candidatus Aenigmatarchaeota archaeon]|nr:MAG: hypothetical protein JSW41_03595 [Candidatus Aenigmarchaeota archaeon]